MFRKNKKIYTKINNYAFPTTVEPSAVIYFKRKENIAELVRNHLEETEGYVRSTSSTVSEGKNEYTKTIDVYGSIEQRGIVRILQETRKNKITELNCHIQGKNYASLTKIAEGIMRLEL
jgi:hypothetical protein